MSHKFKLYDLVVEVVGDPQTFVCSHELGESFKVVGENLVFTSDKKFSQYALATLLPYLPVKQRETDENDWISLDDEIACPDPNCGARFKISRKSQREFNLEDVTKLG